MIREKYIGRTSVWIRLQVRANASVVSADVKGILVRSRSLASPKRKLTLGWKVVEGFKTSFQISLRISGGRERRWHFLERLRRDVMGISRDGIKSIKGYKIEIKFFKWGEQKATYAHRDELKEVALDLGRRVCLPVFGTWYKIPWYLT